MEKLKSVLQGQMSNYMDIDSIFCKLEEDQDLQKASELFQTIFNNSGEFILKDFARNQESKFDESRLRSYFGNNLLLFKNKLVMLVQMIIEEAYNATLSKSIPIVQPFSEEESQNEEKTFNESSLAKSFKETERAEKPKVIHSHTTPVKKSFRQKELSPPNTKAIREISYILRPNRSSAKKRLDSTNNTTLKLTDTSSTCFSPTSKSPSLLNAILSPVNQNRSFRTFDKVDKSFTRNSSPNQTLLLQSAMLNPSFLSQRHTVSSPKHVVQSEFNHIRGHVSFSNASRVSWVDVVAKTDSPGPAKYNLNLKSRSPSPTIGKAQRKCWVDIVVHTDSPGPAKYNSNIRSRSPSPTIPKADKVSWVDVVAKTDSPGPAHYTTKSRNNSPSYSVAKASRNSWVDIVAKNDSPGPAAHYGSMHFLSK